MTTAQYGNTASKRTAADAMNDIAAVVNECVGQGTENELISISHSVTYDGAGGFVGTYFFTHRPVEVWR